MFYRGVVLLAILTSAVPARGQSGEGEAPEAPSALRSPYAIQVNASPEAALVASQLDSLRQRGVPAYRTQTTTDGTTYHRLRVGPFASRTAARVFAQCQGYTDPWIVPATADRAAFGRVVRGLASDVVPLRPRPPRFLLGRRNTFAALLMPAYGPAPATEPAPLRVYTPTRAEPVVIENVTGVREAAGALEYGRAERIFAKDTSEAVEAYREEIEAFSRAQGLSQYLVRDQLALYDGGRMARFTLLGTLALPAGTPELHSQPGFDYVDQRGTAMRHQGSVSEVQAQQVGNARARRLRRSGPTQAATRRAALFARPTERGENAQVCMLFFSE